MAFAAPGYWQDDFAGRPGYMLDSDFCVINNEAYFARTVLRIPIINSKESFEWGVWVSLSEQSFKRYQKVYGTKAELDEKPYFGWLSNQLQGYPDCLEIKTQVHLQGGSMRPLLELDHANPHPLCQEQHDGISLEKAHQRIKELTAEQTVPSEEENFDELKRQLAAAKANMPEDIREAHTHSARHRKEILASKQCGCFYCKAIFTPDKIEEWIDTDNNCALCPECGIDSVIGDKSGYPITKAFLSKMHKYWFA